MSYKYAAIAIVALGVWLRVSGVGVPDPNFDEAIALYFAKFPIPEILAQLYRAEVHPWGFYTLLHLWQRFLGTDLAHVSSPELTAVWMLGTIGYVIGAGTLEKLARELKFSDLGRLALQLIFSTSLYFVDIARQLRTYPWLLIGLVLTMLFAHRAARGGSRRALFQWTFSAALSFSFHYYASIPIAGQAVYLLWTWRRERRDRSDLYAPAIALVLMCLPTAALMANWSKIEKIQPLNYTEVFSPKLLLEFVGRTFVASIPRVQKPLLYDWAAGFTLATLVTSVMVLPRELRRTAGMCAATGLPTLAILVFNGIFERPNFIPRYFAFLALVMAIIFCQAVFAEGRVAWRRGFGYLVLVALVVNAGFLIRNTLPQWKYAKTRWRTESPLPSPRMAAIGTIPGTFPDAAATCRGRAVFSDDYSLVESLLHHCPDQFLRLSKINTQLFFPSSEQRLAHLAPQILVYHVTVPTKFAFRSEMGFFRHYSTRPPSDYYYFEIGEREYWVAKDLPEINNAKFQQLRREWRSAHFANQ